METIAYLPACKKQSPNPTQIKQTRTGRIGIRVLSLLMGCAIVGFTQLAMAQTLLRRGDSGQAVSELQIRLQELGCYNGGVTGVFGEQTEAGVIECQQRFGITADGIVGTETYNALGLGGSAPGIPGTGSAQYGDRLQLGDRGPGVQELQTRLQTGGYYYGPIDGIFGQDTQTAVITLQQSFNLPQTGVVDQQVYAVLGGGSIPPTTPPPITPPTTGELRFGDQGPRVVELQRQLNRLGYPIRIDGAFGSETEDAVRRFQQDRSLPVTGVADARTLNQLGLSGDTSPLNPRRYAVIIPIPNPDALRRVQRVLPSAVPQQSRLGDYVREGFYLTPEAAERRANNLRSLGLTDARVVFE